MAFNPFIAPFRSRRTTHRFTDVLVIGSGLAGLRAANAVDPRLSVLVVTKEQLQESNSSYAQGGIAGVLDPEDTLQSHADDTIRAGGPLCDSSVVRAVVEEGPQRIVELIRWGANFDKVDDVLELGREGGHQCRRIAHARGDATGRELTRAMIEITRQQPNIDVAENVFTTDLLTEDGHCRGAIVFDGKQISCIWAKATILCSGGACQVFRESTNPPVATGDGLAIAFRAGAELRDMEFVQFHPTVLYIAGSSRSLISEAVRGEGGHLVDCTGSRFMPDYDSRGELAPRDVVSQSIVRQMAMTGHANVYLDLSHLDAGPVKRRFPGIARSCAKFGIDITKDRIPVRPAAHYLIGGITVDLQGRTTVPGLFAAGEVASTGLHGANRLASNSLLESLVYGAHAGASASHYAVARPDSMVALDISSSIHRTAESLDVGDARITLQSLMGRYVGVNRNGEGLDEASESIDSLRFYVMPQIFCAPAGWELQNLVTVAKCMVDSAKARTESRGVHARIDHPHALDDQWLRHLVMRAEVEEGRPIPGPLVEPAKLTAAA